MSENSTARPSGTTRRRIPAPPRKLTAATVERLDRQLFGDDRARLIESTTTHYTFFDRLRIWLRKPLTADQFDQLKAECDRHKTKQWIMPCPFHPGYCALLNIFQPSPKALQLLATLPASAMVNYVEPAVDLIPPSDANLNGAIQFLCDHILQPYNRGEAVAYRITKAAVDATGFTTRRPVRGKPRGGRWITGYLDLPSKITGETALHLETRNQGLSQVQKLNIYHPRDLLAFDFAAHFASIPLFEIDYARLGRFYSNQRSGARRQHTIYNSTGTNRDARIGHIIYRALSLNRDRTSHSLQTFTQRFGRGPYLRPYSSNVDIAKSKLLSEGSLGP